MLRGGCRGACLAGTRAATCRRSDVFQHHQPKAHLTSGGAAQRFESLSKLAAKAAQLVQRKILQGGEKGVVGEEGTESVGAGQPQLWWPRTEEDASERGPAAAAQPQPCLHASTRKRTPRSRPAAQPRACMTSCAARGGISVCWLGLCLALPTLASSLLVAMPADEV